MFDQSYGLRFDIYERVHLSEDVVGIEELEEIELVPHIQVVPLGEQATLRGNLLLATVYKGNDEEKSTQTLEHWIPVEITLPMNRVHQLEDISVEIENFDVDLLSNRTLNITGVLSLKGIEMIQHETPAWAPEEFTVYHQTAQTDQAEKAEKAEQSEHAEQPHSQPPIESFAAETRPSFEPQWETETFSYSDQAFVQEEPSQAEFPDPYAAVQRTEDRMEEQIKFGFEAEPEPEPVLHTHSFQPDKEWPRDLIAEEAGRNAEEPEEAAVAEFAAIPEPEPEPVEIREPEQEDAKSEAIVEAAAPPEEKKEMKVALSAKKEPQGESEQQIGLMTLLHSSNAQKQLETRNAVEELEAQAEQLKSASSGDDLEWKNLFLSKQDEKSAFRKVKMCIVQREETLDMIASRYHLNPREIMLYNRLDEQNLSEGQVIYIP